MPNIIFLLVKEKIHFFYLFVGLTLGAFFAIITPPNATPDEISHQVKIVRVASGNFFGADKQLMMPDIPSWYGGFSDSVMLNTPYDFSKSEVLKITSRPLDCSLVTKNVNNTVTAYSPLPYLVSAVVYKSSCGLGVNLGFYLYITRIINMVLSVLFVFCAIKIYPRLSHVFIFISLLPTVLYQFSAVAADAFLISLTILYISYILRHLDKGVWLNKDWWMIAAIGLMISFSKPGYAWIVALSLPVIIAKGLCYKKYVVNIFALCLVPVLAQILLLLLSEGSTPGVVNVQANINYLRHAPLSLISELVNTPAVYPLGNQWNIFESLVGKLGWLSVPLPGWAYILSVLNFIFLAFITKSLIGSRNRMYFLAVALISVLIISLPLYLYATVQPSDSIFGLQGRYFIPSLTMAAISLSGLTSIKSKLIVPTIFYISVLSVSISALLSVYTAYYH